MGDHIDHSFSHFICCVWWFRHQSFNICLNKCTELTEMLLRSMTKTLTLCRQSWHSISGHYF